jgi:hypothetical protein
MKRNTVSLFARTMALYHCQFTMNIGSAARCHGASLFQFVSENTDEKFQLDSTLTGLCELINI